MKRIRGLAAVVIGMACAATASAEVKLASVFSDHMVLQREKPVNVWGTATPGKTVTVKVNGKTATAKAGDDGRWLAKVGPQQATATPVTLAATEEGANTVTISDVLVGDVWVCSGQSNMQWTLARAGNAAEAIPAATDTQIRLLPVPRATSDEPLTDQSGQWVVCSPEAAKEFSAVGYFFGKEIRASQGVPVGLVGTYWGGTPAESWTPEEHLASAEWAGMREKDRQMVAAYPAARAKWEEAVKAWEAKPKASRGPKPGEPRGPQNPQRPSVLWNAMVEPLVPMTITGAIWYQGEANAGRAEQYRTLFPRMIAAWREEFRQGDFPFLFVQLANYKTKGDSEAGSQWAELREAQALTLEKLPNTGMAVAIDVGDPNDIHPTDKLTVGRRLALAAEKIAYGKDVVHAGPTFKSLKTDGNTARVTFDHAKGLKAKGGEVAGFTVAGKDRKFVPAAKAQIDGDAVVVTAPAGVERIEAVRYGWADDPQVSLYNAAGLPAVPFRTDDWPMVTAGKE